MPNMRWSSWTICGHASKTASRLQRMPHALCRSCRKSFRRRRGLCAAVKIYGQAPDGQRRYSPAVCIGARKRTVEGHPDVSHISTSHVERQNLTMRMLMRRFTRLTNAFSKKLENHIHALALYFVHYNFCRIHKSIKTSPAMAAGITDTLWSLDDVIAKIDEMAPPPKKCGPYKKRAKQLPR